MVYVTAQLFGRSTIGIAYDQLTQSHTKQLDFIKKNLNNESVAALSNDLLQNWNTTYSLEHFGPCKNFDGPVDKDSNRQIPHTKFHEAPLLNKLVDTFTEMVQYLTIDMVWLIVKSKPGSGFQSWHQDFNLNKKIIKTIVINLGAVKRSDLLGGPLRKVVSDNKDKSKSECM
jgi:ribonucleotide monophosphatase NagD (HAD superfamily)